MSHKIRSAHALPALALLLAACAPSMSGPTTEAPSGRVLYGLTTDNRLVRFGSANPDRSLTTVAVTGLAANDTLVGIDFEPGGGASNRPVARTSVTAVSKTRIYSVDVNTGAATAVGTANLAPALEGGNFGVDYNPTVNRVRVHSDTRQNLRLNQETGAVVDFDLNVAGTQLDLALAYKAGDPNAGQTPVVTGTAYTFSVSGATATTLYAIDSNRDVLVTVAPPNDGVLNTVGSLGVDTSGIVGFDIVPSANGTAVGTAFAALSVGNTGSALYTIDLASGAATRVGPIGSNLQITGLAVAP